MRHAKTHDIIGAKCKVGRSSRIRPMSSVPHLSQQENRDWSNSAIVKRYLQDSFMSILFTFSII